MANNGTGSGGKVFNDRVLAAEVRTLTLEKIKAILIDEEYSDKTFKKAIILKLTGSILPRLNEVSGPDGEPLYLPTEVMKRYAVKAPDPTRRPEGSSQL